MARYTINLPDKVIMDLDAFAVRNKISRDEAIQRAFALLAVANAASRNHQSLGVVEPAGENNSSPKVIRLITGA